MYNSLKYENRFTGELGTFAWNAVRLYMVWAFLRNVLNARRLEMQRPRVKAQALRAGNFQLGKAGSGFWGLSTSDGV